MSPPAVYLQEVPVPRLQGQTNAALVNWAVELQEALNQANFDKRELQKWAEEQP